ncbi:MULTISPECIES: LacI family DNA-binding transcriptional regulator [unclassified Isoptericola]|uniref:LacI family DNA-binding transcriptional regulator n=1 Tax=unclassified Isoptericola TaxID=2623355 RepID=UPI0036650341
MASAGRPTVRDIARHAGVSVATVSRVTRDDPKVAPATRERVQASIDALGYTPSALGLGLAYQRHHTLGIVLPGLGGPYFADLVQGVESVAVEAGIAVNVLGTHFRPDAATSVRQLAQRTDALVVQGGTVDADLLVELAAAMPVVVVAAVNDRVPTVRTDGRAAADEITSHLIEVHGYRRLRFLGSPRGSSDPAARYRGFRDALAAHGLEESAPPLDFGFEAEYGAMAARELDAAGELPEALVCANDELAFGVMATLPGLGHPIPAEMAIVGFDDNSLAALASPTLTTVHQPTFELGATAARIALEPTRDGSASTVPLPPDDRVLETRAVIRESCGCQG